MTDSTPYTPYTPFFYNFGCFSIRLKEKTDY